MRLEGANAAAEGFVPALGNGVPGDEEGIFGFFVRRGPAAEGEKGRAG